MPKSRHSTIVSCQKHFDVDAVLDRFMGDIGFLCDSIQMLNENSSELFSSIKNAIAEGDHSAVSIFSHSLKGILGIFTTGQAFVLASRLETMGREADLSFAEVTFSELLQGFNFLLQELNEFVFDKGHCNGPSTMT